ncbi:MAG: 16S rRNA (adenine(1518)-N(6)/adenine(1519)-N(6))-dimethyltransferase RsmA [Acidobacteria bacterium]|nr:16S rRNA (adenine(1518)-N(6)/adenine(1519)-N(6))-dimethyltransferase RsmA [Acidobacteriota bacterium]
MACAACPQPEPLVIEIGPGQGALTRHLLERAGRVVAIEVDPLLAARLEAEANPRLTVVHQDVLATDLSQWGEAVVAGNLPYYITSPILTRILAARATLKRAVLLVQKEVADRIASPPGSRDYGYLSVVTQLFTSVETLFKVPPGAFQPPPKVDSAVIRLTPRPVPVEDADRFLRFAGWCFEHKRKTLRNNLAPHFDRELLLAQPEASLRAEQLSVEALIDLYRRLSVSPRPHLQY